VDDPTGDAAAPVEFLLQIAEAVEVSPQTAVRLLKDRASCLRQWNDVFPLVLYALGWNNPVVPDYITAGHPGGFIRRTAVSKISRTTLPKAEATPGISRGRWCAHPEGEL
jgi:hypothetical protein